MNKDSKVFVTGGSGLVGSAIVRKLQSNGYQNILVPDRRNLDLTNQFDVDRWFDINRPDYVFLAAAKVGGINSNKTYPADFIKENLQIQTNVIDASYRYGVKKLEFLGSVCFKAGHQIFTNGGYKKIEDVKIGDYVLTHTNNFREVYNTNIKKTESLIEINSCGNEKIECTLEHKFLTKNRGWVEAKDLTLKDYLCINKKYNNNENFLINIFVNKSDEEVYNRCVDFVFDERSPKNPEEYRWERGCYPRSMIFKNNVYNAEEKYSLSYLIGVYLAEGFINYNPTKERHSSYCVSITPGYNIEFLGKIERSLSNILNNNSYKKYNKRTSSVYTINSKILCEFFLQFYDNMEVHKAHTKIIPEFVFNLSKKSIINVIRGYWEGDGNIYKRKDKNNQYTCSCSSVSKQLIYGIRRLLLKLGIFSSVYKLKTSEKQIIENRVVNQRTQYSLRINGKNAIKFLNNVYEYNINIDDIKFTNNILEDEDYFYCKITSLNCFNTEEDVYDLTVVDDHSYTVNDVIVHNCIYPKETPQPIREEYFMTGPLEPTNQAYALAKIAGVMMCQKYKEQYGFNCISLMPINQYGIQDRFHPENSHVIPGMINKFVTAKERNEKVVFWGDGSPIREFMFSDDLADACLFLMDNYESSDIINVGVRDTGIQIKDLAEKIRVIVGYDDDIIWDTSKPNGQILRTTDVSKLYGLGWKPQYTLDEGLKVTYDWFMKNREVCR